MSKQLLQKYINEKTIMKIKNLKLDIIAFDENHFSGITKLIKRYFKFIFFKKYCKGIFNSYI